MVERVSNPQPDRQLPSDIENESPSSRIPAAVPDLTLGQKMASALSGSILTSLLVTPLDVVRIRLQSQQAFAPVEPSPRLIKSLNGFPAFAEIPADLGISSCCRQSLFVHPEPFHCLVGPNVVLVQNPVPLHSLKPRAALSSLSLPPSLLKQSLSSSAPLSPPHNLGCAVEETRRRHFSSTLDGLVKISRHEGITTLWRGLTPTLAMAVPANVIYYSGYDWLRTNDSSPFNLYPVVPDRYVPLIAGSSARIVAAMTISPIEMLRTRLQATPAAAASSSSSPSSPLINTLKGMRSMVETNGFFSLWRGLTLTLWRDAPFSAIYWFGYESFRQQLSLRRRLDSSSSSSAVQQPRSSHTSALTLSRTENTTQTLVDSFTAGALAGSIASIVTQPFDVGKTRKQVINIPRAAASSSSSSAATLLPEELPMIRFIWHIFNTHGVQGLFQGGVARLLKVAPSCAIMISTYEIGKKMAAEMNVEPDRS